MALSHYILLYSIANNILYIPRPHNIKNSMVCFGNITNITFPNNCTFMKDEIINNNTRSFTYEMKEYEQNSKYFKIAYFYAKNDIFYTDWIKIIGNFTETKCLDKSINKNITKCISDEKDYFLACKVFGILNLSLSIFIFTLLMLSSLLFYRHT